MPTRVIDVGSSTEDIAPRIFVTGGIPGAWVAFSHCWGGNIEQSTTTKNIEARRQELALHDLPNNFRDAIIVTRWLRYQYIWIDSLCILQDSEADWAAESRQMSQVYKGAVVTLNAEYAANAYSGFLHPRTTSDEAISIPYRSLSRNIVGSFSILPYEHFVNARTPLKGRGWALQELLLAPRTLHFHQKLLSWTCQTARYSEHDPLNDTGPVDPYGEIESLKRLFLSQLIPGQLSGVLTANGQEYPYDPLLRWYLILNAYATMYLTKERDKLPAISGVARETHRMTGLTYRAGLWLTDLHRGLLWSVAGRGERVKNSTVPTWSWASLRSNGTELRGLSPLKSKISGYSAYIQSCSITLADHDAYGQVLSGKTEPEAFINASCR